MHANLDGVEHKIASAAVFRSEGLTKSSCPILEGETVRPWDGTMMRQNHGMDGQRRWKYFQIEGEITHSGYKEHDVATKKRII
jgi:hypothetical protein